MERRKQRTVRYDGEHCRIVLEQSGPSVIVLRISGTDVGEFGEALMARIWTNGSPKWRRPSYSSMRAMCVVPR
jgi:hypothetical protein